MLLIQIIMKIKNFRVCTWTKKKITPTGIRKTRENLHLPLNYVEGSGSDGLGLCMYVWGQRQTNTQHCTHMFVHQYKNEWGLCYGNCSASQLKKKSHQH